MTFEEARDAIQAQFHSAWLAQATTVVGYVPEVRWPDAREKADLPQNKFWARLTINVVTAVQSTLAPPGERKFTSNGIVTVQLFGPAARPSAGKELRALGNIALTAYRGISVSDGVWYRNTVLAPLSSEPDWLRYNLTSEFIYDERA